VSDQLQDSADLLPGKASPSTHWTGGCMGPSVGPDSTEKRKPFAPVGNRIPVVQTTA